MLLRHERKFDSSFSATGARLCAVSRAGASLALLENCGGFVLGYMPCPECERLRGQCALAFQTVLELVQQRNEAIRTCDPNPAWQLDYLIEFATQLHDQTGQAFALHRAGHWGVYGRVARPRRDDCKRTREGAPSEFHAVRKLMGWVKYSSVR